MIKNPAVIRSTKTWDASDNVEMALDIGKLAFPGPAASPLSSTTPVFI